MAAATFEAVFGAAPQARAEAPGRVNLLGDHTDYNDGFVLPAAIPQRTRVAMRRNGTAGFALHAAELGHGARFELATPPTEQFARYVYGCLRVAQDEGVQVPGLDIHVASDVPMGVGLSSSAALEVATLRCLRELLGLAIDDVRIAQLGQRAEIEHAGVNVGILDQMASSLASTDRALFLDTRSLERRAVPLPAGSQVLVLDSGAPRSLAASGYNQRRAECEQAARTLGLASLRDVRELVALEGLPELLRRRARHVFTENRRVLQAVEGVNAAAFGALMNESHASLRDDYESSAPEVDRLQALLQQHPHVHGARITGGGFGGACVALVRAGTAGEVAADVLRQFGPQGRQLVPML